MKLEKSCGAIIYYNHLESREYLLIQHKNGGHWSFPKGHVENDETEIETALREIAEETGLWVRLISDFRHSHRYQVNDEIEKEVVYFLAEAQKPDVIRQEAEVSNSQWLNYSAALQKITYPNDQKLLELAETYLS